MKTLLIITLLVLLSLTTRAQVPGQFIESVGKQEWKVINGDTLVYMIQKDPYRPRMTRMMWASKRILKGYRIKLYTPAQMDSIRATTN